MTTSAAMGTRTDAPIVSGSSTRPQTADEYLESLKSDRSVYIYGERVEDVTTHPAFRNSAASIARQYKSLHDPSKADVLLTDTDTGSGGKTHPFFKVPETREDLVASRDAIYSWQQDVCGWMGRTPDYKASLLVTLGADPSFFGEFEQNAAYWYRRTQEEVLHVGHAIVHPPVDRALGLEAAKDVFVRVERETDNGLIVSGAKVVATGAALTQYCYVSHFGPTDNRKEFSLIFMAPMNAKGVKLYSRQSYEAASTYAASPFDYPLSNRFDENDAILVFKEALIPWENVIAYSPEQVTAFNMLPGSWMPRAAFQASTRLQVKLEFIIGLVSQALEITGAGGFRGVQAQLGELLAFRNFVAAMRDASIQESAQGFGRMWSPKTEFAYTFAAFSPGFYTRMKQIIESIVASGLIYLNSNAVDFLNPEIREDLDRFMRGSNGKTALDRSKVMKALWDSIGSEFGARHELYELNYWGQPEKTFIDILDLAGETGEMDRFRAFAKGFLDEYDLNGWKSKEFYNPGDLSALR